MEKQIKTIAVLLMFLASVLPAIASNTTDNFEITKIVLNGDDGFDFNDFNSGDIEFGPVYAGEKLRVKVFWKADENLSEDEDYSARIRVELADVEEETEWFTVRQGWEGYETLVLNLDPDVFDIDDADELEKTYRLHVIMEDENGDEVEVDNIMIKVVNQKHYVEIYDVNFPNGKQVKAGQILQVNVGVRNRGHTTEEDITVKVSIPELGLSTRTDKFDLYTENEFLSDAYDDDDFHYKLYKTLFLPIPLDTVSGNYDLDVEVTYNDGDNVETKTYTITVTSGVAPSDVIINIADSSLQVTRGQGAAYKLTFANLGNEAVTYTIDVSGVSEWGTARVDPKTITIGKDETKEVFIFVTADEDAPLETQTFKATVKTGDTVVKEFELKAHIKESTTGVTDVKEGLQIGFLILLVVLVILGIILIAKKLGKEGKEEEPFVEEDQTYY
jgi:hypothetical protein